MRQNLSLIPLMMLMSIHPNTSMIFSLSSKMYELPL
jgi:hypothetical protein